MKHWLLILCGLNKFLGCVRCIDISFDNHTLVNFVPFDEDQLNLLRQFNESRIEIFKMSRGVNCSLDILVPPDKMDFIKQFSTQHNIFMKIKHENYGRKIIPNVKLSGRAVNPLHRYNSYPEMLKLIRRLAKQHPKVMQVQVLGQTFQGRNITMVKLSSNPGGKNPIIFIDAGIHAREWIAGATSLYLIHKIVENREMLAGLDWYIIPLINPDGYEYSRTRPKLRLWRKTMSKRPGSVCFGVDGNRNYGFKWGTVDSSKDPCEYQTYAGSSAFSERETQAVKNIMSTYLTRIKLYLSLHSYGQLMLYPWSYSETNLPPEWHKFEEMGTKVSEAIRAAGGEVFQVMSSGKLYPASGSSIDYAFHRGIPFAYTIELTDGYEFSYPEKKLPSALEQYFIGIRTFGEIIGTKFGKKNKSNKKKQLNGHLIKKNNYIIKSFWSKQKSVVCNLA